MNEFNAFEQVRIWVCVCMCVCGRERGTCCSGECECEKRLLRARIPSPALHRPVLRNKSPWDYDLKTCVLVCACARVFRLCVWWPWIKTKTIAEVPEKVRNWKRTHTHPHTHTLSRCEEFIGWGQTDFQRKGKKKNLSLEHVLIMRVIQSRD